MSCYMMRNPKPETVLSSVPDNSLVERKKLLVHMMSDRKAIRVLHAPALFGKTAAAFQYAKVVFDNTHVLWVDAGDPRFIRDIDSDQLLSVIHDELAINGEIKLFVFDGLPHLTQPREDTFCRVLHALHESEAEIIITTRYFSFLSSDTYDAARSTVVCNTHDASQSPLACDATQGIAQDNTQHTAHTANFDTSDNAAHQKQQLNPLSVCRLYISARDLLCSPYETSPPLLLSSVRDTDLEGWLTQSFGGFPAVFYDRGSGLDRFVDSFIMTSPASPHEVIAYSGLICSRGSLSTLTSFVADFDSSNILQYISNFPYLKVSNNTFTAFSLSFEQRFAILDAHLSTFKHLSGFASEQGYLFALGKACIASGDTEALHHVLSRYLDDADRAHFCHTHNIEHCASSHGAGELLARRKDPRSLFTSTGTLHREVSASSIALPVAIHDSSGKDDMLEINLLGKFELKRNERTIPERGELRKLGKILIALLVANHTKDLPRRWVEQAIWPEAASGSVSSNYYNLWGYVKRVIARNEQERMNLGRTRDSISLRGINIKSDVHLIDKLYDEFFLTDDIKKSKVILEELSKTYQGPFVPGIENAQIEAYRMKYLNKVQDVFLEGIKKLYDDGDLYTALRFSRFVFQLDYTREDVCYTYMLIQKNLGQGAGAIDTYCSCRNMLVDRYGIEAPRRLDALYQEILEEISG